MLESSCRYTVGALVDTVGPAACIEARNGLSLKQSRLCSRFLKVNEQADGNCWYLLFLDLVFVRGLTAIFFRTKGLLKYNIDSTALSINYFVAFGSFG